MGLKKLIDKKNEMADYMVDEITHIIKTKGKRGPGDPGEKEGAEYMADVLRKYSDDVKIEPFDLRPGAFYGWIYITITCILAALVCAFFIPIVSVVLIAIGFVVMIAEFVMYREFVDFLFKKKTSHNVIAVKHPKGEVKRRIFFNGHIDAAPEWLINYHFGGAAFVAHFVIAVVGTIYLTGCSIAAIIINKSNIVTLGVANQGLAIALYAAIIFVPAWILMYFLWSKNFVVDGANDNLTGCYIGISILKAMHDEGVELENTEVGVLLTGAEEAGLRGAKAFCKAHKGEYQDVDTIFIAYDTMHEEKYMYANTRDLNGTVKADEYASNLFLKACKNIGVNCSSGMVPLGSTDSAAFNQGGFRAVCITALNHNLQDYYHTRRDTYDNLDKGCLASTYAASIESLRMFDEQESVS